MATAGKKKISFLLSVVFLLMTLAFVGCDILINLNRKFPPPPDSEVEIVDSFDQQEDVQPTECLSMVTSCEKRSNNTLLMEVTGTDKFFARASVTEVSDEGKVGVVWESRTINPSDIIFAILDITNEAVTEPLSITDNNHSEYPSVIKTRSGYGVVWHQEENNEYKVGYALVSDDGTSVITSKVIIGTTTWARFPSAIWADGEVVVVWQEGRGTKNVIGFSKFTEEGDRIDSGSVISPDDGDSSKPEKPDIAWTGSEFGVVWTKDYKVYFTIVSTGGSPGSADIVHGTEAICSDPRIVADAGGYAIAWTEYMGGGNTEIFFTRYLFNGTKLIPPVRVTTCTGASNNPDIRAFGNNEYAICWEDGRNNGQYNIYSVILDSSGLKKDFEINISSTEVENSKNCQLILNDEVNFVLWDESINGVYLTSFTCP